MADESWKTIARDTRHCLHFVSSGTRVTLERRFHSILGDRGIATLRGTKVAVDEKAASTKEEKRGLRLVTIDS